MNKELTEKLHERYHNILRDLYGDPRKTCMAWGIDCGDGWYQVLDELFEKVTAITSGTKKVFVATQIKEKFGGLRVYYRIDTVETTTVERTKYNLMNFMFRHKQGKLWHSANRAKQKLWKSTDEKIDDAVMKAESKSFKTCEKCGAPGSVRRDLGWIKTLCDTCRGQ